MNSMKLVIQLYSLYWSIHTKDESKRRIAFAFIFGVNWLWRCGVTASFGVFFHEITCNGMTSFMEFRIYFRWPDRLCHSDLFQIWIFTVRFYFHELLLSTGWSKFTIDIISEKFDLVYGILHIILEIFLYFKFEFLPLGTT